MDQRKHILIVDDVTTNLKMAADVLKDNYRLSLAKSGSQALDFLSKNKPDLILLDIKMPGMDGYETLERIKADKEIANIPVVFLTVDNKQESEIKGLKMGAMDFILKPFEPQVMLSRIEKILQIEDLRMKLSNSSQKDPLTDLWNRKYLEDEVNKFFSVKNKGVFVIADVDNFKKINDTYGHIFGDSVLCKLAHVLNDNAGPRDIVARLGGDEFVIFLKGDYTDKEINQFCTMIMNTVHEELKDENEASYYPSISMGIAVAPNDGDDFITLYNKADKALYYVKQNAKDNYHYYRQRVENLYSEIENFNSEADMNKLESLIKENVSKGAMRVEYDGFKHIVNFVSRTIDRSGQKVWMILFTLVNTKKYKLGPEELEKSMKEVERAIVVSLRKGDVTTQYSSFQYITLLLDADEEDSRQIAQRIISTWQDMQDNNSLSLVYDLKKIEI